MKTFRIKHYKRGFIYLYRPQIKTWFGWMGFCCFQDGSFMWGSLEQTERGMCERHIENYRLSRGLLKSEIEIIK